MRRHGLIWHLNILFIVLIVVMAFAVSWYAARAVRGFHMERTKADLEVEADLVARIIISDISKGTEFKEAIPCSELAGLTMSRLTVVREDGTVLCDTKEEAGRMENHADRPEIIQALAGRTGESVRFSDTLRQNFMYVAVPVRFGNETYGVVRVSVPLTFIDQDMRDIRMRIFLGGLIAAVAGVLLSLALSRRISGPLSHMRRGIDHFSRNELSYRIPSSDIEELGSLADVMNEMAASLEERMNTVMHQRNEQEAIFLSMVEGLLVVDSEERILKINKAAGVFLDLDSEKVVGMSIQEAVRNTDMQEFVALALSSEDPVEADIRTIGDAGEGFLQAHGSLLKDSSGDKLGAVIVLDDITRLRRLEGMRKDFVANVSHELRTPITSIKGFVETLLDGNSHTQEDRDKFLRIIAKQADRMNAIIEDLLFLSRMERDVEASTIRLAENKVKDVLADAIHVCESRAKEKDIEIVLESPEDLEASISPPLLEQAVINLIDNAVKYSERGDRVEVRAEAGEDEVVISVSDRGCGIEREHLPRLFERFYRADKARSRKLGGTGLGLAIVKHIIQAHHGSITVESTPGEGSTFSVHLPV
jgi:two-component system phosphate regulon sensor histidine kinase PhoR